MLFCMWGGAYKRSLDANRKRVAHEMAIAVSFFSRCLSGSLLYVRRHIIRNNVLSVSLNKTLMAAAGYLTCCYVSGPLPYV